MRAIDLDLVKHWLTVWARVVRGDMRGNLGYPKRASFTVFRVDGARRSDDRLAHDVDAALVADQVTTAVEALVERERVAIIRRYVHGWSFQQIANEIGLKSRDGAGDLVKRAQIRLAYLLAGEEAGHPRERTSGRHAASERATGGDQLA